MQGRAKNHAVHWLYRVLIIEPCVIGLIKMGNIAPRARIEYTSLAVKAIVLPFTPPSTYRPNPYRLIA